MKYNTAKSMHDLGVALKKELEEEEKRHTEMVAKITEKYKCKKEEITSKDGKDSEEGGIVGHKRKAEKSPLLDEENDKHECKKCDSVPNEDDWRICHLCSDMVCKKCVNTCEDCQKTYCVGCTSDMDRCEDCETGCIFVCCRKLSKVACGDRVCSKCYDEFHSVDCDECHQDGEEERYECY